MAAQAVDVRIFRDVIRVSRDGVPLAEHARLEGTGHRRRDPAHYAAVLDGRPRARLVLERERLCALGPEVSAYVTVISQRRRRVLAEELAACTARPQRPTVSMRSAPWVLLKRISPRQAR